MKSTDMKIMLQIVSHLSVFYLTKLFATENERQLEIDEKFMKM